jgi:hypothetical protein
MIAAFIGLLVGGGTLFAAWRAAHWAKGAAFHAEEGVREARRSADAFVAAEDARLVVEFPSGSMVESYLDSERQPDTYFFDMTITNMGRSAARVAGWTVEGLFDRNELTLGAGATWTGAEPIQVSDPDEFFEVAIHYSSPLRGRLVHQVAARIQSQTRGNGAVVYFGHVTATQIRPDDE